MLKFQISVESVKPKYWAAYTLLCKLIMVTIVMLQFANISRTKHTSAVKFHM